MPLMPQQATKAFTEWLVEEMNARGWSQSELARRAEVSPAAISDVLSGRRNIGKDLASSIAEGLKLPPDLVFRAAGLLPPDKKISEEIEQILHEIEGLPKEDQLEILSYIRWRNNQRKK